MTVPKIGDTIYVPTSLYIGHGRDDFAGGKGIVDAISGGVSGGEKVHFVSVKGANKRWNWEHYLAENQEKWKKEYGNRVAHPDPDWDPQFNTDEL